MPRASTRCRSAPASGVWSPVMSVNLCDRCGDVTVDAERCHCTIAAARCTVATGPILAGPRRPASPPQKGDGTKPVARRRRTLSVRLLSPMPKVMVAHVSGTLEEATAEVLTEDRETAARSARDRPPDPARALHRCGARRPVHRSPHDGVTAEGPRPAAGRITPGPSGPAGERAHDHEPCPFDPAPHRARWRHPSRFRPSREHRPAQRSTDAPDRDARPGG